MRKTRLVILPTKCLNQMGFLLLFLSCPVIGDWGRIRPESENSHRAIQIAREGTCGLQRDPPGGLVDFLSGDGSHQCRPSESDDFAKQPKIDREAPFIRKDNRRVDDTAKNQRVIESLQRRVLNQQRTREQQRRVSTEILRKARDTSKIRKDVNSRRFVAETQSLNRIGRARTDTSRNEERVSKERRLERSTERFQRETESERRTTRQRLSHQRSTEQRSLNKKTRNMREARRLDAPGREINRRIEAALNRRISENEDTIRRFERRNDNRMVRASAQREKERLVRYTKERRENNENPLKASRQERTTSAETRQPGLVRKRRDTVVERRISLTRAGLKENPSLEKRRVEIFRNVDSKDKRSALQVQWIGEKPLLASSRRKVAVRRSVSLPETKLYTAVRNDVEKVGAIKAVQQETPIAKNIIQQSKAEDGVEHLNKISKWMGLENYEAPKVGEWTTNCIIGAVAYFLTSKRVKMV